MDVRRLGLWVGQLVCRLVARGDIKHAAVRKASGSFLFCDIYAYILHIYIRV